jgi:hypothetical protein
MKEQFTLQSIAQTEQRASLVVELTRMALAAPDVPAAVGPILDAFVGKTAADGSAYFQVEGAAFHARAAVGVMPAGPVMEAILAHGLPAETPLMRALESAQAPLYFDDTSIAPEAAGFPDLGVKSLAAAPVRDRSGALHGAFLMHTFDPHPWSDSEAMLVGAVANGLAGLVARLVAEEEAVAARESAIRALGLALETRDRETAGHTDRVTDLAQRLGSALELPRSELNALRWGAYLHDIGKLGIADAILLKPGKLDDNEWATMRSHAVAGHAFASQLSFLPADVLALVRHHHERWDGKGYPDGLAGEAIPLPARIFALCDVYDALVSERPYKRAWTHDEAVREIAAASGTQFDPAVVNAFLALVAPAS